MTADLTTRQTPALLARFRIEAIFSALMVTCGALLAAVVVTAAALVTLPLMFAASMTARGRYGRRGWTELELAEA